jgi:hypothetical protein
MTKDEALRLALESLEYHMAQTRPIHQTIEAITAIKEALAQPKEPEQEPVAWEQFYPDIGKPKFVAQPEQEPVAWMNDSTPSGIFARHIDGARNFGCTIPLYTNPPQRKPQLKEFVLWLKGAGYDTALTYDTERSKWLFLSPMAADLWKAWQAAHGIKE